MQFDENTFRQFIHLARQRPEWREELRRVILTEELLGLPERLARIEDAIERLVEVQVRAEERHAASQARTEQRLGELAAAQARTEQRLERLETVVETLAQAQARTEQRLEELAAAQARTEQRLERLETVVETLAQAQARTEQRLERLETVVETLAQAQARIEQRLEELTAAQVRTEQRLHELNQKMSPMIEIFGTHAEREGRLRLVPVLETKGYRPEGPPRPIAVDGEVDVAVPVRDPAGQEFWVLLEAKARLHRGDVAGWHRRFTRDRGPEFLARLEAAGVSPPFLRYAYGLQVYDDATAAGVEFGVGILADDGERVAPRPWSPAQ